MMHRLCIGLVLASLASPALALSCLRPDVARSYQEAVEAKENYVVVLGKVHFDERRLPKGNGAQTTPSKELPARLSGKALSSGKFSHPFHRNIKLDVQCLGPWCGQMKSGASYLMFVQAADDGTYTLSVSPCGGRAFYNPKPEMIEKVKRCNSGGSCQQGRR